jgi:hypothetical protein
LSPKDPSLNNRFTLDKASCEKGIKVSDAEVAVLNIHPNAFHDERSYTFEKWSDCSGSDP